MTSSPSSASPWHEVRAMKSGTVMTSSLSAFSKRYGMLDSRKLSLPFRFSHSAMAATVERWESHPSISLIGVLMNLLQYAVSE